MGRSRRWWISGIVAVALGSMLAAAGVIAWRASHAVRVAEQEVRSERIIKVSVRPFRAVANAVFQPVSAPAVFGSAAVFQEHLYVAGPAGLLEYDLGGVPKRQFLAGRDLPPSSLVAMTST